MIEGEFEGLFLQKSAVVMRCKGPPKEDLRLEGA